MKNPRVSTLDVRELIASREWSIAGWCHPPIVQFVPRPLVVRCWMAREIPTRRWADGFWIGSELAMHDPAAINVDRLAGDVASVLRC